MVRRSDKHTCPWVCCELAPRSATISVRPGRAAEDNPHEEQLLALYDLQEVDVKISGINARLAELTGAKPLRQRWSGAKSALQAAEKSLNELETELSECEVKLKSIDEKRTSHEKRLYGGSISSPKELDAVEREIKALKDQQGALDGRTLELYELVEGSRENVEAARRSAGDIETELRKALKAENTEKARLEADLAELMSQRAAKASQITDKPLLSRYEAIGKRNGGTAIAMVKNNQCSGCHVSVTSFTVRQMFLDKDIPMCENCGRMLILDVE